MKALELLRNQFNNQVSLDEKRVGVYQLIAPLYHEDGDMIEVFLEPRDESWDRVRICDHAMSLMRLSYSFNIDTPNKERILARILSENGVTEDGGNLCMEVGAEQLCPAVLQFAQTVAKVCNMQLYRREVIQNLFYEQLTEFVEEKLAKYHPRPRYLPIAARDDLEVDFEFAVHPRAVFLFGVRDATKARLATIACLEFQRAQLPFRSFVVHEDFDTLGRKDRNRITSAADKQFVSLDDFRENARATLDRESPN